MLAKHEMFEEIGGGETSKQGQEIESVSCQANNVGQFRQALTVIFRKCQMPMNHKLSLSPPPPPPPKGGSQLTTVVVI